MKHRHSAVAFLAATTLALGCTTAAAYATGGGQDDHKTALCHRTASDSNPYVFIEVDNHALQAHLTNDKGHFPTVWKSAGVWRGVEHAAGDAKDDYLASSMLDCEDTEPTDEPTEEPTDNPTDEPTDEPTENPTIPPTPEPTDKPNTPNPHHPKPHHNPTPQVATSPVPPVVIDAGL